MGFLGVGDLAGTGVWDIFALLLEDTGVVLSLFRLTAWALTSGEVNISRTPSNFGEGWALGVFTSSLTPVSFGEGFAFGVFNKFLTPDSFGEGLAFGVFNKSLTPDSLGEGLALGVFNNSRTPLSLGELSSSVTRSRLTPERDLERRDFADAERGETIISPGPSGVGGMSE